MSETCNSASASSEGLIELDRRVNNGLEVTLYWAEGTQQTQVIVNDTLEGTSFSLEVPPEEKAREVFNHPYAYMGSLVLDRLQEAA